jgi:hypothetical protein
MLILFPIFTIQGLEHLQQSRNTTSPIRWYWGSPISLLRFIGGDVAAIPQYISPIPI